MLANRSPAVITPKTQSATSAITRPRLRPAAPEQESAALAGPDGDLLDPGATRRRPARLP